MYNFDLTQKAIIENNNHNNTTLVCGDSGEPVTISTIPPVYLYIARFLIAKFYHLCLQGFQKELSAG
jgi:hypothetical protein